MTNTAIILAGGLGTRLRSVLPDTPKCLAPVGGKPFLEILVRILTERGFDDIVLALGYGAEAVQAAVGHFASELQEKIRVVKEDKALGTGGAMLNALAQARVPQAVVVNGDTYFDGDLSALLQPLDEGANEQCRMAIIEVADRSRYGGIELEQSDSPSGIVKGFLEKGASQAGWINAGYYRLCRACFAGYSAGQSFSFEDMILPALVERQGLRYTKLQGNMIDIGIPVDYRRFCTLWS